MNNSSKAPYKHDLSIIIPVHNGEQTLERCLKTILVKSEISQEIILINDASTDNSLDIISYYADHYSNVYIINNIQNLGAGLARNKGLELATGYYVGFVDCDDWVDCNLFVTVVNKLRKNNSDIAVFGVRNEYGNTYNSVPRYTYTNEITFSTNTAINLLTRSINNKEYISPMICQKVFRHNFLKENRITFIGNRHFEDDIFSFSCFMKNGLVTLIPSVEYHYMQSHHSVSHKISKEYVTDFIRAFSNIRKELEIQSKFRDLKNVYFSYMDKCLASFLSILITEEQNVYEQKKYLALLFSSIKEIATLDELIEYIDLSRIKKIWL